MAGSVIHRPKHLQWFFFGVFKGERFEEADTIQMAFGDSDDVSGSTDRLFHGLYAQSSDNYRIEMDLIAGRGGSSGSTNYLLSSIIGQPCNLKDGRYLVAEYKGADRWSNDDSKEKRRLGELWALKSRWAAGT